jgi:hypothetical protein
MWAIVPPASMGNRIFPIRICSHTLSFSGDQIRCVDTEIGTLVSVTIRMTIDTGGTTFSLLIPRVNIPGEQAVPIQTDRITTLHKFSVFQTPGQRDSYSITPVVGTAMRLVC